MNNTTISVKYFIFLIFEVKKLCVFAGLDNRLANFGWVKNKINGDGKYLRHLLLPLNNCHNYLDDFVNESP